MRQAQTPKLLATILFAALSCGSTAFAQIERVWLSHRSHDPSQIVVSWTSKTASESVVRFGLTKDYGQEVRLPGTRTLHHVEIPVPEKGTTYHYSAGAADDAPLTGTFKSCPTDELRIAVV